MTIGLAAKWEDFWPAAQPLFELHQQELGEAGNLELDEVRAKNLWENGFAILALAHWDGVLIGYAIFYLTPALDRRGIIVAEQGPFFVAPEFRTSPAGLKLWKLAIGEVKNRGASESMVHLLRQSPKGLRKLYEREGGLPWAEIWRIKL